MDGGTTTSGGQRVVGVRRRRATSAVLVALALVVAVATSENDERLSYRVDLPEVTLGGDVAAVEIPLEVTVEDERSAWSRTLSVEADPSFGGRVLVEVVDADGAVLAAGMPDGTGDGEVTAETGCRVERCDGDATLRFRRMDDGAGDVVVDPVLRVAGSGDDDSDVPGVQVEVADGLPLTAAEVAATAPVLVSDPLEAGVAEVAAHLVRVRGVDCGAPFERRPRLVVRPATEPGAMLTVVDPDHRDVVVAGRDLAVDASCADDGAAELWVVRTPDGDRSMSSTMGWVMVGIPDPATNVEVRPAVVSATSTEVVDVGDGTELEPVALGVSGDAAAPSLHMAWVVDERGRRRRGVPWDTVTLTHSQRRSGTGDRVVVGPCPAVRCVDPLALRIGLPGHVRDDPEVEQIRAGALVVSLVAP